MPNRIFFFSDIDDTLIQTKRKTDFNKKTIVGAYDKNGDENSFFYEGTKIFIDTIIKSNITFIPTTARNLNSYKRTIFYNNKAIKYAILKFRSPSCGSDQIYDGTFSHTLINGDGICAKLLKQNGISIFTENKNSIKKLEDILK